MATDPEMTPSLDKKISDVAGVPTEAERVGTAKDTQEPIYKMMPDSKIPVSKSEGNLWKGRRDSGRIAITNVKANWKEAEAYYSLGQDVHRSSTGGERAGNAQSSRNPQRKYSRADLRPWKFSMMPL